MPDRIRYFPEPFFLQWHLTDQCPLACRHCYRKSRVNDLSSGELLLILDKFTVFLETIGRTGRIQWAGGEPFLSSSLFKLIKEAKLRQIPSRILSSGIVLTDEMTDKLKDIGCQLVQISIDGAEETHDYIRGEGSFQKAVRGAKKLRDNGIEVTFSMTLSKLNKADYLQVFRLAEEYAQRVGFHRLVPTGSGEGLKGELLSKKDLKKIFSTLHKFSKQTKNTQLLLRDPLWHSFFFWEELFRKTISGCSCGYNGLTIESNGDIYPCRRLPIKIGNALTDDIFTVWKESEVLNNLRDRDKLKGKCRKCLLRWNCGGCRAISWAVSGDYLNEDPQCFL